MYREYKNLLIRPVANQFEHSEPSLPEKRWHGDWYWRLTDIRRKSLMNWSAVHGAKVFSARSRAPRVASNYILFAPDGDETLILGNPPIVAEAAVSGKPEKWGNNGFQRDLRRLLRTGTERSLRTSNVQRAHRHITIRNCDPADWRQRMRMMCQSHALRERKGMTSNRVVGDHSSTTSPRHRTC